ncbi:MAG: IS1182 family transposase [Bacteroidota bacterium]
MAFNMSNRSQSMILPDTIEDYVATNAPVRVYDAFVDALNFSNLGISLAPNPHGGADEYYPKDLLKLLIYGTSYGIRSSRKLERACHDNLSFIWLMGGQKPDYRTIARFRIAHKAAIKKVLKECVRICLKLDLIEGNVLFIDGSKFRADAAINNTWTKERCEKYLKKIEERIDQLMNELVQADAQEEPDTSMVKIKEHIHDKEKLVNRIKGVMSNLETTGKESINSTDPDCVKAKGRQGTHAIHNFQSTVDGKHGLIVHAEAVSQSNDYNQLSVQVQNAVETIGKNPQHVCADAGYSDVGDIKTIDASINIVVPSHKQAQKENDRCPVKPFDKEHFTYDSQADQYICPAGSRLVSIGFHDKDRSKKRYQACGSTCQSCAHFGSPDSGKCTSSVNGRLINRLSDEELKEQLEANYQKPENQTIYKLRKQTVEHPFGHIKRNLGAGQFLLRGTAKVNAEVSVLSTCFNLARMITILGIPCLLEKLTSW